MIAHCNFKPEEIWVREIENNIRHITLRRNFEEKVKKYDDMDEIEYNFEETNIYIVDRENMENYISNNFNDLFEQGLKEEKAPFSPTIEERMQLLENTISMLMEV